MKIPWSRFLELISHSNKLCIWLNFSVTQKIKGMSCQTYCLEVPDKVRKKNKTLNLCCYLRHLPPRCPSYYCLCPEMGLIVLKIQSMKSAVTVDDCYEGFFLNSRCNGVTSDKHCKHPFSVSRIRTLAMTAYTERKQLQSQNDVNWLNAPEFCKMAFSFLLKNHTYGRSLGKHSGELFPPKNSHIKRDLLTNLKSVSHQANHPNLLLPLTFMLWVYRSSSTRVPRDPLGWLWGRHCGSQVKSALCEGIRQVYPPVYIEVLW